MWRGHHRPRDRTAGTAWPPHHRVCSAASTTTRTSRSTTAVNNWPSWMEEAGRYPSCRQLLRRSSHGPLSFIARTGHPLSRECRVRRARHLKISGMMGNGLLALGLGSWFAGVCRAFGTGWFGHDGRQVVYSCTDILKSKHSLLKTPPGYPLGDFTVGWYFEYS